MLLKSDRFYNGVDVGDSGSGDGGGGGGLYKQDVSMLMILMTASTPNQWRQHVLNVTYSIDMIKMDV